MCALRRAGVAEGAHLPGEQAEQPRGGGIGVHAELHVWQHNTPIDSAWSRRQLRSTAVDLVRASEAASRDETALAAASTEEVLAEALHTAASRPQVVAAGHLDLSTVTTSRWVSRRGERGGRRVLAVGREGTSMGGG
jgi:hypothetical protein